jgi:GT2 family glycosyltransferase
VKKFFVLTVVYNTSLYNSLTINGVLEYLKRKANKGIEIEKFFVFDNSTDENLQQLNNIDAEKNNIEYLSCNQNIGLAKAYNETIKVINDRYPNSDNWLMITDQDTYLNDHLFVLLEEAISNGNADIYIPRVQGKKHMISPLKVNRKKNRDSFDLPDQLPKGLLKGRYTAINSCSVYRVSLLNQFKGFNEKFPLDYLDRYMYYLFNKSGAKLYCLDIDIKHELSFDSFQNVKFPRYKSFLVSQMNYVNITTEGKKLERYSNLLHNFYWHARRTLLNRQVGLFIKGSIVFVRNL